MPKPELVTKEQDRAWGVISSGDRFTNKQLAERANISRRAARGYTRAWAAAGFLQRHRRVPLEYEKV